MMMGKKEESDQLVLVYIPCRGEPEKFRHNSDTAFVQGQLSADFGKGRLMERGRSIRVGTAKIPAGDYDFHIIGPPEAQGK